MKLKSILNSRKTGLVEVTLLLCKEMLFADVFMI